MLVDRDRRSLHLPRFAHHELIELNNFVVNLCRGLGFSGGVQEFDRGADLGTSSRVQAVVDFYGPTELFTMQRQSGPGSRMNHDAPGSPESKLIGGAVPDNKARADAASPITYVSRDDAPILIVHGDTDPMVPLQQSEVFLAALRKAGVDAELYIVKGGGHGGFRDPTVEERVPAFLDRVLKRRK